MWVQAAGAQLVPDQPPEPIRGLEVTNHLGEQAPLGLSFFDEQGNAVKLEQFFNRDGRGSDGSKAAFKKPVVLVMLYFSCPLQCPQILDRLTASLAELDFTVGSDFDVVMISFDPRDKPRDAAVKKAGLLLSYNRPTTDSIREGWTVLTSSPAAARELADAIGFPYRYMPNSGEFSHPNMVFVLTPEGKISRVFPGVEYPRRDMRFALMEASNGKIGTVMDWLPFWCYHYDPQSGSYTLAAMRVMQVAGVATVVVLGGLLGALLAYDRRKARRLAAQIAAQGTAENTNTTDGGVASGSLDKREQELTSLDSGGKSFPIGRRDMAGQAT